MTSAHPISTTVRVRDDVLSVHAGDTGIVIRRLAMLTESRPVLVGFPDHSTALYADADLEAVDAADTIHARLDRQRAYYAACVDANADDAELAMAVDHLRALEEMAAELDAATARIAELEADLEHAEAQRDRFLAALHRALPGHYESVLWFHYTSSRWSISDKFHAWVESPKNTVGPFDALHWMQVFGVLEGDVARAEPTPEGEVSHD